MRNLCGARGKAVGRMWDLNLCVILHASFTPTSPFGVVVTGVRVRPIGEGEGFVRVTRRRRLSLARSLTKSNFAPAMMHDARRITDVDVDRVRQRTAISCLARFSRVDEAAFSFSLPLCILGWKPPPRAQFGRLPLYSSLCLMDENVIASTANGVGGTE